MRLLLVVGLVVSAVFAGNCQADETSTIRRWVTSQLPELVTLYRDFHAHPELSFMEEKTAAKVAQQWREAGFEITTGVGGYGVVGVMKNGDGPLLMLRTDLDALPVTEQTDLIYASKVRVKDQAGNDVGVMHACGHDVHITNMIAVARFLGSHKELWKGTLVLIGQPAEERGRGAQAMLDDKLFDRFGKPDVAIALHVFSELPAGSIGYKAGYAMANVDSVDITVKGRGGHGAYPHTANDPIVQAAELIMSLQTIVSREIKPTEPAVVTVGAIHGGTKHNIIGDECKLQVTIRSYSDEVHNQIIAAIKRRANGIAQAYGAAAPDITVGEGTPALINDEELATRLRPVLEKALGKEQVRTTEASMGGEDFGRFGRAGVPILMLGLGAIDGKRLERLKELKQPPPGLHSPVFFPDDVETTLTAGIIATTTAVLDLMKK